MLCYLIDKITTNQAIFINFIKLKLKETDNANLERCN